MGDIDKVEWPRARWWYVEPVARVEAVTPRPPKANFDFFLKGGTRGAAEMAAARANALRAATEWRAFEDAEAERGLVAVVGRASEILLFVHLIDEDCATGRIGVDEAARRLRALAEEYEGTLHDVCRSWQCDGFPRALRDKANDPHVAPG